MRRRTLRNLLLVLVPAILVAGAVVGVYSDKKLARRFGLRPKLDWANATTLVFEVDVARSKKLIEEGNELLWPDEQPNAYSSPDLRILAETVKKRIDPEDEKEVIVRPSGETRIEVVIPPALASEGGAATDAEFASEVRLLLGRMGKLEFRILANTDDDPHGIADARHWIDDPPPEVQAENDKRATRGLPPLGPRGTYPVQPMRDGQGETAAAYQWLALAPEEVESLRLSPRYADPALPGHQTMLYGEVESQRGKTYVYRYFGSPDLPGSSYVLYSRKAWKEGSTPVEYFLLTRVSDLDAMKMTGGVGLTARVAEDPERGPAIGFELNKTGAAKFRALTERNQRTSILRNLAIVIDGQIVSSPTLNAVLGEYGSISGNYTEPEARRLARLLNSGTLDVALKLVRD